MSRKLFPAFLLLAGATLLAPAALAVPWEIGGLLGVQMPDTELTGVAGEASEFPPTLGLRGDVYVSDNWGLLADGLFSSVRSSRPTGDATMMHARAGAELLLPGHRESHQFYFTVGLGLMNVDLDNADSFTRPYWSLGLGKRWAISDAARMRVEVRGDRTLGDHDDAIGRTMRQLEALVGLSWAFGVGKAATDSDGDGVTDDLDRCPDTPKGATVDARGCPEDTDRDGVRDGIDTDGDGVRDAIDQCPDTPKGTAVDTRGCPKDSDGDGVTDDKDKCPNTPAGLEVDMSGCPKIKRLYQDEPGQERAR